METSDNGAVDEQIWTFSRNGELLEIRRTATADGYLLGVDGDGAPRSYGFDDLAKLETFQADFEKFLLGTGWTFVKFSPERRTGRERRHYSRLLTDRRRWWTDGAPSRPGHTDPSRSDASSVRRRRHSR
jgi:hypothetical protein